MSERFDEKGNLSEEGMFDKEGKELKFDESGKVIEDLSADALHKVADKSLEGSEGILSNEDDNQVFLEGDDLDDLFEEVPIEETEEEKVIREKEEEDEEKRLKALEEGNELPEEKEPESSELIALRARVKELELGNGTEQKPITLPEDDTPMTVGKFKELQDTIAHNETIERQNFTQNYILSFYKEGYKENMEDKDIDALFAFLQLPENNSVDAIHYTNNKMDGTTSGVINFNKIIRVFNKKHEKVMPLNHKKVKPEDLLHGKGKLGKTKRVVKVGKLDEFSQRFIKSTHMSEDDIAEALGTPSNIQSRGGRKL